MIHRRRKVTYNSRLRRRDRTEIHEPRRKKKELPGAISNCLKNGEY